MLGNELKLLKLNLLLARCSLPFSSIFFYYFYGCWSNLKTAIWDQNSLIVNMPKLVSFNPEIHKKQKYRRIWDNCLSIIFIWISNNFGLINNNLNTLGFQQHLCPFKWNIRAITSVCAKDSVYFTQKIYFFYFTLSLLQNTHISLSIIHTFY